MLEDFPSSLVRDVASLLSEDLTAPTEYKNSDIGAVLSHVTNLLEQAREYVLGAIVDLSKSPAASGFIARLGDISGLLYTIHAWDMSQVLPSLYRALEDITEIMYNEDFIASIDLSTFAACYEKLEYAVSYLADAVVDVQRHAALFGTPGSQREGVESQYALVKSARRAAFITCSSYMSMLDPSDYENEGIERILISHSSIRSAVSVAKLVSLDTPKWLRNSVGRIAITRFTAIKNLSQVYQKHCVCGVEVGDALVDAASIYVGLVAKYAGKDFETNFHQANNELYTQHPKLQGILLLEGMFHASYAAYFHGAAAKVTPLYAIRDCFLEASNAFINVRKTYQNNPENSTDALICTQITHMFRNIRNTFSHALVLMHDKRTMSSFTSEIRRFIDSAVVCAYRSLDILLEESVSHTCVWDSDILHELPGEVPSTLTRLSSDYRSPFELISSKKVRDEMHRLDYYMLNGECHMEDDVLVSTIDDEVAEETPATLLRESDVLPLETVGASLSQ